MPAEALSTDVGTSARSTVVGLGASGTVGNVQKGADAENRK